MVQQRQQILKDKSPYDEEPLYMYLSHQAVHDPLGLPPDDVFNDEEIAILNNILATSDVDGHLRQRFAKVSLVCRNYVVMWDDEMPR